MPTTLLPRAAEGEEIGAHHINLTNEALERQRLVGGAGIKVSETPNGTLIAVDAPVGFWAKVGAGSGFTYAWTEQVPDDAGTWVDGPRTGTTSDNGNPIYEVNQNSSVSSGKIVWVRDLPGTTKLFFTYSACS